MKLKPLQWDSTVEFWPGIFGFFRRAAHISCVWPCPLFISENLNWDKGNRLTRNGSGKKPHRKEEDTK